MNVLVVGLTGGIASGKTTVSDRLAALGAVIIDTDAISRALSAPGGAAVPAIAEAFPEAMSGPDLVDRARLRHLVFASPLARARLEAILHPRIGEQVAKALAEAKRNHPPYAVLVVPLLVETGTYLPSCRAVIVMDCPVAVQIERAARRPGMDETQARKIVGAQATREERLAHAQFVLDSSGTLEGLARQVAALHRALLASAAWRPAEVPA